MFSRSLAVFCLVALAKSQDVSVATVQATLNTTGVIPDVLPSNFTVAFPFEVCPGCGVEIRKLKMP